MPLPTNNNHSPKTDDTEVSTKFEFDHNGGSHSESNGDGKNNPLLVHSPGINRRNNIDNDGGAINGPNGQQPCDINGGPDTNNGQGIHPNPNINGPSPIINSGPNMNHSNHSHHSHHSHHSQGGGSGQDNGNSGGDANNPTTAMLDACIRDLSRRRMVMAQQAAATASAVAAASHGGGMPGVPGGGPSGMTGSIGPSGMGGGGMGGGGMGPIGPGRGGVMGSVIGGPADRGGMPPNAMGNRSAVAASAMGIKTEQPPSGPPTNGGAGILADYAGTAADSFAQAFVDRWASSHSKDPAGAPGGSSASALAAGAAMGSAAASALAARAEGMSAAVAAAQQQAAQNQQQPLTNNSYHSLTSEGSNRSNRSNTNANSNINNAMTTRRSSDSGSTTGSAAGGNKQWWVCDFCKNKAFISRVELKEHEMYCDMNPMGSRNGAGGGGPTGIGIGGSNHSGGGPRGISTGAMGAGSGHPNLPNPTSSGLTPSGNPSSAAAAAVMSSAMNATAMSSAMGASAMSSAMAEHAAAAGMLSHNSMHSMGNVSRAGSLGSSAHSMGHHHPAMGHPALTHHPAVHRGSLGAAGHVGMGHAPPGHHPHHPQGGFMPHAMNPYMGMMCGDAGMMMNPHHNMPYGMPPGMPSMAEAAVASAAPQRRKSSIPVINPELIEASKGPFRQLPKPLALALDEDKDWLTPLHCFVRKHCVEVFTATELDVQTPSKGKRKPIQVGQIGIRCPHCHEGHMDTDPNRERGSVYYPTSLSSIYNATMNLLQRHLHSCPKVPAHVMSKYTELKKDDARSGTSKKYWVESAKSLGFVDTLQGIKLSAKKAPPPPSTSVSQRMTKEARGRSASDADEEDGEKKKKKSDGDDDKDGEEKDKKDGDKDDSDSEKKEDKKKEPPAEAPPLVILADKTTATAFSYLLLGQMQPCVFTEADRLGKRKGLPTGFAGLACRHCFGGYGSGRFFPSSIKTLSDTSKTLNVLHNHMARCRKVPKEVLEELEVARATHDDERAKMKFGSQKAFFAKIWSRLHDNRPDGAVIKPPARKPSNPNSNGGLRRLSSTASSVGSMGGPSAAAAAQASMMRWNSGMGMGGMGMNGMMMGGMGMGAMGMAGAGAAGMGAAGGMGGMPQNMMQHPMMAHMGGFAGAADPQMMAQMGGFPHMGGMPSQMGGMGGMPLPMGGRGAAMAGMDGRAMAGMDGRAMAGMDGRAMASMDGRAMAGMDGSGHGGGGGPSQQLQQQLQQQLSQGSGGGDNKRSLDMLSSQANEMRKRMRLPPDHREV